MQEDSDLSYNDEDLNTETHELDDTPALEVEAEKSESSNNNGERQEGAKSNFVDFDKIPDENLRNQVKARVGELYRKSLEGEKAAAEARKAREELESLKSQKELVEVAAPDAELAIDDPRKFAQQQKDYVEYLAKKMQREQAEQAKAAQLEEATKREFAEKQVAYQKRIKDLNVDAKLLESAAAQVESAVHQDLVAYLFEHQYGPAIVTKLGSDFEELYKVSKMSPLQAVAYIESSVVPKAVKRKNPSAPNPPTKVTGARPTENSPVKGWKVS